MTLQKAHIQLFLDNYALALAAGDLEKIAAAWTVPSLVANDDATIPVSNKKEIQDFFRAAKTQYESKGITSTEAYIQDIYVISLNLFAVQVKWLLLSDDGNEHGTEANYYIIRQNEARNLTIDFSAPIYTA